MERRILVVNWAMQAEGVVPREQLRVMTEALRLSVWRVGCIALACRVRSQHIHMVIECNDTHEPHQLIEWVRAAARYAITCYSGVMPVWEEPYEWQWVERGCAGQEIMACWRE
jgi:REP element-mobilizing transposase RayT